MWIFTTAERNAHRPYWAWNNHLARCLRALLAYDPFHTVLFSFCQVWWRSWRLWLWLTGAEPQQVRFQARPTTRRTPTLDYLWASVLFREGRRAHCYRWWMALRSTLQAIPEMNNCQALSTNYLSRPWSLCSGQQLCQRKKAFGPICLRPHSRPWCLIRILKECHQDHHDKRSGQF